MKITSTVPSLADNIEGRYLLRREISRSDSSVVFEAVHCFLAQVVCLKQLNDSGQPSARKRERLLHEAKLLALSRHPNVVYPLDAGVLKDGKPYLVMEMLHGRSLEGILTSKQKLPLADVIEIAKQISEALSHLHANGVIHRNLQPANIFLSRNELNREVVKIIDFGVAVQTKEAERVDVRLLAKAGDAPLFVGKPEYTTPDAVRGSAASDPQRDIYALGVMMYECLTGVVPFSGSSAEIAEKVAMGVVPSLVARRPDVPPRLEQLIVRALGLNRQKGPYETRALRNELVEMGGEAAPLSNLTRAPADVGRMPQRKKLRSPEATRTESTDDRRKFTRVPYVTPVRVIHADGTVCDGQTQDISEGGVLMIVQPVWSHQIPVKLRFVLPVSDHVVTIDAVASWSVPARNTFAIGLAFLDLPAAFRVEIARYIRLMETRKG